VFGGFQKFGDGRCPLNPQHSLIASPPRDHTAVTDVPHQKMTETIVQFLDVGEHAHRRMVVRAGTGG
jgi:hypothetical protein